MAPSVRRALSSRFLRPHQSSTTGPFRSRLTQVEANNPDVTAINTVVNVATASTHFYEDFEEVRQRAESDISLI